MSKKLLNEKQVSSLIYRMVRESLEAMPNYYNFENNSSNGDENDDTKSNGFSKKKLQIQKFFSQDGVNPAAYAYKLFNIEPVEGKDTNEMKNARSLFMKKLHNEQNQDGSTYDFTSEELNALHSLISGEKLAESKNGKMLMNEEQFTSFINEMVIASVKKVLKEMVDYDNDLDYERIYQEASHFLETNPNSQCSWRQIAKAIGFMMDTIGPNDMETLKDAIEDAMADAEEQFYQ